MHQAPGESPHPPPEEKTSSLIRGMLDGLTGATVTVGRIVSMLRRRSFGGLFLILAIFSLVPGISFFAGLAMLVPALQMALGWPAPRLPRIVGDYEFQVEQLKTMINALLPWIKRSERYVKPRWTAFTRPPAQNLLGLLIVALVIVIMAPLPFSNFLPALAVVVLALGLLEKDGVMIVIGSVISALALVVGVTVIYVAIQALDYALANPAGAGQ